MSETPHNDEQQNANQKAANFFLLKFLGVAAVIVGAVTYIGWLSLEDDRREHLAALKRDLRAEEFLSRGSMTIGNLPGSLGLTVESESFLSEPIRHSCTFDGAKEITFRWRKDQRDSLIIQYTINSSAWSRANSCPDQGVFTTSNVVRWTDALRRLETVSLDRGRLVESMTK